MADGEQGKQAEARDGTSPRIISPPAPHAGIVQALRASFALPPKLPEAWIRLLERLR